jgi:diacylglycerol kinase family enzyme
VTAAIRSGRPSPLRRAAAAVAPGLSEQCGIEPIVLQPGDDLRQLAEDAVARGADLLGMAGGDGSQALVASVASQHGVPFVVVPAGTRNHFALDLGLDRTDVPGDGEALAAQPPLRFVSRPGALTVRLPRTAPGRSPAVRVVRVIAKPTLVALWQTVLGGPIGAR